MDFIVEFYETGTGKSPVLAFLEEMRVTDRNDYKAVLAGLEKLRNRSYHQPPLSKPIGDKLFELRHVGKLNTRNLYFSIKGKRIILVHGIRNKSWEIKSQDRQIAITRMNDWNKRKKHEEEK